MVSSVFRIASFDGIVIPGEVGSIIFRSDCLEIHDNLMAVREILRWRVSWDAVYP